jgi:DNA mismatch repair protein MutS2
MIRSSLGREALQEALITERNGRLVLPVRAEARRRLPGLVHDVSESGATIFVEPLATVALGNRWRELQLAEAREAERVLRELSSSLAERAEEVRLALDLLTRLDLALAKGRYALALDAHPAGAPSEERPYLRLVEARHPLLRGHVVPISLELGHPGPPETGWSVLVVTGPNAGGKTVALKTVGLLALMHQAGLHVPAAAGTILPIFDCVYADIGDQQSIEQSLSTFTSHMTTISAIMAEATPRSLVLLDEVGASTDPEEGAALAKAVLVRFLQAGVPLMATTHHRGVAAFAQETPGMANASVELDPATLAPTYRLTLGLPGRSYALAIASRLGLPPAVLEQARSLLGPQHRNMEELLAGIQLERQAAAETRAEAEAALDRAEALRQEADEQLERLQALETELLQGVRRDLQARADDLLERLRAAERSLAAGPAAPPPLEKAAALRKAKAEVQRVRREARPGAWRPQGQDRAAWLQHLSPGDAVHVRGFPGTATLLSAPDAHGMAEVAVGALRARIPQEHLLRPAPATAPAPSGPRRSAAGEPSPRATPAVELDLRGLRVDEALARLEPFLDRALLQGASRVRVVHGMGTGALRAAVRERLGNHPAVRAWEPEGGRTSDGATVAELA